ncbi:hypothetical protein JTE90_013715 [Oedothorax gibbosus]|uniref:Spaetzle domain-containing protein n=1 Tax=Oedothorax gibbosus TaxID=931172 RepID=A0AAV6V0W2_9ARAC|nr:hypothetical protein JTE90_013715 [Oedothorax gibbosus]
MEHRQQVGHLLITLLLLCHYSAGQPPNRGSSRPSKAEKSNVVFPSVSNETEHSLPVFPDDPVAVYVGRQLPLAPPSDEFGHPLCAKKPGDTFCENVDNYPVNEIRHAINYTTDEFVELFGTMSISSRKFGDLDEDTVCPQISRLFYPKAAVNENDHWAFVVNDIDYVQTVMAEICQGDDDQPCNYLQGTLPYGVTSKCRQKYAYKRMLALHPNKKRTYTDAFRFPSCCVCYVKKPFLLTRARDITVEDTGAPKGREKSKRGQIRTGE